MFSLLTKKECPFEKMAHFVAIVHQGYCFSNLFSECMNAIISIGGIYRGLGSLIGSYIFKKANIVNYWNLFSLAFVYAAPYTTAAPYTILPH